jgi:predicted Na+-dependent transporter
VGGPLGGALGQGYYLIFFTITLFEMSESLKVNAGEIAGTPFGAQFLPLCVGLVVRQWRPNLAAKLKKPLVALGWGRQSPTKARIPRGAVA